ncbi:fibronectin type III domain-containing protein [Neobacillus bataviensis LMG 21833]|uniref:Fibronectin type III domain-containing protein n=1 Tax=Neobacillus bataviensis LMG 21833 TaxID=1117379 RepID=K6D9G3_9BACI|nr:hypothetical protein [Neobacillus bataviensis]EKN64723.1 fibronectin type III domain-containing protein [Neobacillus bataviensis LMG 21833]
MSKIKKKLSFFVLAVLLLQLFSPIASAFAASNLTAPTNIRFSLDGIDNVVLRWDAVSGATTYRVYEIKGEEKVQLSQTSNLNRYFPTVSAGTHTYAVTAVNSGGESPFSTSIDVEIKYPEMQAPNGFTSTILNGNDVSLKWSATEFANSYKIYEVKNGERVLLASTTTLNKTFLNVVAGQHKYELTSYNDKYGESKASFLDVNIVYPEMAAPGNLSFTIYDINNATLSWKEVPFADSYNVYQIVSGERKFITTTTNIRQYIANIPEGENVYEVTANSSKFGESKVGSKITVKIAYPEILPPDQINSYFYNGNDLLLMWSSVQYANTYNVYQVKDGKKELIVTTPNRSQYINNLPEGDYTYEIAAVSDRFGNSTSKAYNVTVAFPEMQAPKAILTKDTANSAIISWGSVPYATEYEVYKLVGGQPTLIGTTSKTGYPVKDLEQGKHEYTVIAKSDRFGNSTFSNVVVAEVKPVLPAPQPNKPEVKGDSVTITWEPVKEADKYNVYEEVDGERVLVGTTTDPTITVDTPEKEGTHEYIIVPVTKDGTESIDYATVEVEIDKPSDVTAPVTVADTNEKWSKEDVSVTLTATDDISGVKSTYYSIDHGEFVEGTDLTISKEGIHTVSFYSVDNAGNVEKVKTVDVKIDKQAPETVINTSAYWYNNGVNVELTAKDNLSGVKATYYSVNDSESVEGTSFTLEKEGIHKVSFYSVDNVGNVEDVRTVEVKIDKEAPVTTAKINENTMVDLSATDNLSGVHSTYYSVNGSDFKEGTSFEVDQAGVNKITFYSVDNAGNMEPKQTIEVKVDTTAPVTVSNVDEKWYTAAVNVELTATDDLSKVKATYYSIDGAEFTEGTSFTIEQEGVHTLTFYSVDNAGNIEDKNTVEVKVDKTAPVTVSNVDEKWNTAGVNVELTAADDLSGVKATYYSIDGAELNEGTSFTIEKEGIHTLTFYSVDNAGNIEDKNTVEVKVDKTAPVTVSNIQEKWNTAAANVELTATDDQSGVKATYYSIDGAEFIEGTSFTIEKEGIHTLTFYSVDNAGNIEDKNTVEVKVDKTAPNTVSNIKNKWNIAEVNVELTATDDLSGVKATYYSIDGAAFKEGTSFTIEKEGIHTVTFYSKDNAGNIEEKHTAEVKIDKTAPTIKANFPTEFALGTSVSLNYEAADTLSGIKESFIEVNGVVSTNGKITFNKPGINKIKITAIDNAGLQTIVEKTVAVYIQATIEVTPKVINCNNGEFTVRATLPKGYSFAKVDLSTVTINNVHALNNSKGLENQAKNGQFKFERDDFVWDEKEEHLVFRAIVDGVPVVGSTTVEVINNQKNKKKDDCKDKKNEQQQATKKDCDNDVLSWLEQLLKLLKH